MYHQFRSVRVASTNKLQARHITGIANRPKPTRSIHKPHH
jgi:hypothetical protein